MLDFGPRNRISNHEISSDILYGSAVKDIVSQMLPEKEDEKSIHANKIGYFIDHNYNILKVKVGHGWHGYEGMRKINLENKSSRCFSEWDYEEKSTHVTNLYVSLEDAQFVLKTHLMSKIIKTKSKILSLNKVLKNIPRQSFVFNFSENYDEITITNGSGSCVDKDINTQLVDFVSEKIKKEITKYENALEELNEALSKTA